MAIHPTERKSNFRYMKDSDLSNQVKEIELFCNFFFEHKKSWEKQDISFNTHL